LLLFEKELSEIHHVLLKDNVIKKGKNNWCRGTIQVTSKT